MSELDTTNGKWNRDNDLQADLAFTTLCENFEENTVKGVMEFLKIEKIQLADDKVFLNILNLLNGDME
jgi:hypothetical protein